MATTFDPTDPTPDRFSGYGLAPFPDQRDIELDEYVAGLRGAGAEAIAAAIRVISVRSGRVLDAYADRTATRAVRDKNPDLLVTGLVALVVGGLHVDDRDALLVMAPIHDAAQRSGSSPDKVIREAAKIVGEPGNVYLYEWLSRPPEAQGLARMGYEIGSDESGFRYVET